MCGIAGSVGPRADTRTVVAMLRAIAHRGEAAYGRELDARPGAILGAARLAIQDEPRGRQPFLTADGRTALVMNGEIYNAPWLRGALGADGPFETDCDTEVALRAYLRWGEAFAERLRGMFALAIVERGSLVLARDPLGIKPLYLASDGQTTWFASELKAFHVLPDDAELCELAPGSVWRGGRAHSYWTTPDFNDAAGDPSPSLDVLARTLHDAVLSHLPGRGRLACLLSGGVDSSTVLMLASELHEGRVEAWTLAAPDGDCDDLACARDVCDRLGVPLRTVCPSVAELSEFYCSRGVWMTETWEPALVRNAVSYHFLCRAVSADGHKVALSGEGADEVFGGYDYLRLLAPAARDEAIRSSLLEVHRTYLQMADRAAMAATLEVRVPYMDRRLVEVAAALPTRSRLNGETNKWVLRHAHPGRLPAHVRFRPKLGMNQGAGYGSNDPGASIYHRAVNALYRRDGERRERDLDLVAQNRGEAGVALDDLEETYNFARYLELRYGRLATRARPQLNVSSLRAEQVAASV
jgi:asparagine synthase (glutamine-hydrolysing)